MQLLEGELVLSPSDLTGFAACAHLTELNLLVARGELARPERHDPELEIISRAGDTHEGKVLAGFRAEGRSVVEVAYDGSSLADLRDAEAKTLVAMQSGADVVYQATFFDGRWRGHADFLLRVEEPSELGSWSYEVADAKLARRVKAAALLQMSAYSEQVERLQGRAPTSMHVLTGDGQRHAFRVAEYSAYFRTLKAEYEARVLGPPTQSYPDKVEHCGICRWSERCDDQRRADDHLSTVGGMRSDQIRKLNAVGITTAAELAAAPAGLRVAGIGAVTSERLRRQAALQLRGADADVPVFERLALEVAEIGGSNRGLAGLPEPSPGDLFFDMEGDPFATEGGLEYLFGVIELVAGEPKYHAFWGHDRAGEKRAFGDFMDFVADRRRENPGLHIYHYAPYEPSAVKRLMGLHGTREDEVDGLLRDSVFVDLYRVLKQSVQVSTDSYSLKKIEALYMERASGEVMSAASSIVAYEEYLEVGDPGLLESIAEYNEADCESTRLLRDWLEARRSEAEQELGPLPRPEAHAAVESEAVATESDEVAVLVTTLGGDAGPTPRERRGARGVAARAVAAVAPARGQARVVGVLRPGRTRFRGGSRRRRRVHRCTRVRGRGRADQGLDRPPLPVPGAGPQVLGRRQGGGPGDDEPCRRGRDRRPHERHDRSRARAPFHQPAPARSSRRGRTTTRTPRGDPGSGRLGRRARDRRSRAIPCGARSLAPARAGRPGCARARPGVSRGSGSARLGEDLHGSRA